MFKICFVWSNGKPYHFICLRYGCLDSLVSDESMKPPTLKWTNCFKHDGNWRRSKRRVTYLWCRTSSFLRTWESPTWEENRWKRQQLCPPPRRAAQQGNMLRPQVRRHTHSHALGLVPYCVDLIDLWNVELSCFGTDTVNNYKVNWDDQQRDSWQR